MKRYTGFLVTVVLAVLALSVEAQTADQIVIGWIGSGVADKARQTALENALREHGINAKLELRFAQAELDKLPELAADLVRSKPHVIVAYDAVSTAAAKKATSQIPIVMAGASDPVSLGLVQSLAHPGANVTGLSSPFGGELAGKWVELLREVSPKAKRIALLWNPEIPAARQREREVRRAAKEMRIELVSLEVRKAGDFEGAFGLYRRSAASGLIVDNAPFIMTHAAKVAQFITVDNVPAVVGHPALVRAGALLSYGTDYGDMYRKAAGYVVKILKGARPADLPVEQPTKYELVVNLAAAKALGMTIPAALLVRADATID